MFHVGGYSLLEYNYCMTHYDTLHVTPAANQKLIERAYRTLSQEYHPDHNPEIDRQKYTQLQTELNKAYEVLRDPDKRKAYDETLTYSQNKPQASRESVAHQNSTPTESINAAEPKQPSEDDSGYFTLITSICTVVVIILIKKYFF